MKVEVLHGGMVGHMGSCRGVGSPAPLGRYGKVPYYGYHCIISELVGPTGSVIRGKRKTFFNTWNKAVYKADLKGKPLIMPTTEAVVLLQSGTRRAPAGPMAPHSRVSRCPLSSLSLSLSLFLYLVSSSLLCTHSQLHHDPPTTCLF